MAQDAPARPPSISIALERVGGLSYAKTSASNSNDSASLFSIGVAGATINPYAIPRLGIDYITPGGLTVGGALGFTRFSGSSSSGNTSSDLGSVTLYTLTPRVGYRIPLSPRVDLTPRGGLTLAGGSITTGDGRDSNGVFAVAVGVDAPFAFRLTDSFNILAGAGADFTVAATASSTSNSGASSSSSDIKGSFWSLQAWLGIGGYL